MKRWISVSIATLAIASFLFISPSISYAETQRSRLLTASPYELIDAVNALRVSYGLPPYSTNSILMATAQYQADYMASSGAVSHTGEGGSSVTDRLLAAGYPLAGDLSLGGFRSENITAGGETMSAQAAVKQWSEDSVHLATMISPDLTEIGAGISVNNGQAYFVIDCARPTSGAVLPVEETLIASGTIVPPAENVMIPVAIATPDAEGKLYHVVQSGQTLWQIAISYNTKIDEIKRLNGLSDNDIYPGMKLLIRQDITVSPALPIATAVPGDAINGVDSSMTATYVVSTLVSTPLHLPGFRSNNTTVASVLGIVALALLGGALFAYLGNSKP